MGVQMIYLVIKNQRIIANDIVQLCKPVKTDANSSCSCLQYSNKERQI